MALIHMLAEMEYDSVVTIGEVKLSVGKHDKAGARIILDLAEKYDGQDKTTAEVEGILFYNLFKRMLAMAEEDPEVRWSKVLDDDIAQAYWEALWWLRFIGASEYADKEEAQEGD